MRARGIGGARNSMRWNSPYPGVAKAGRRPGRIGPGDTRRLGEEGRIEIHPVGAPGLARQRIAGIESNTPISFASTGAQPACWPAARFGAAPAARTRRRARKLRRRPTRTSYPPASPLAVAAGMRRGKARDGCGKQCAILRAPRAPVAQPDRVVASEAIGRGFESLRARQLLLPRWPMGPQPVTERILGIFWFPPGSRQVAVFR
jgi:hypothetical protein